jgi:hypothetical protein
MEDIIIKSVKVWNGESSEGGYVGERTFIVYGSDGTVISTATVYVQEGEQRLDLNLEVPQGSDYRLISDSHKGLWRDTEGADFPYDIGGIVSIKQGIRFDGIDPVDLTAYFFFYDWEISTIEESCISDRVSTDLLTEVDEVNTESRILIYPNPTNNYIVISNLPVDDCYIVFYNGSMQNVKELQTNCSSDVKIELNDLSPGIYYCKIISNSTIINIQKLVIVR